MSESLPKVVLSFDFTGDLESLRADLTTLAISFATTEQRTRYVRDPDALKLKLHRLRNTRRDGFLTRCEVYAKLGALSMTNLDQWRDDWRRKLASALRTHLETKGATNISANVDAQGRVITTTEPRVRG